MKAARQSKIGQVREAAASLGPLDYVATVALLAVYAVGTSLDEGPKTSLDFYRSAATVIPTLLVAVAIQGRLLELSSKITFPRRFRTVMLAVVVFGGENGGAHDDCQRKNQLGSAPVRVSSSGLARTAASVPRAGRSIEQAKCGRSGRLS